MLYVKVIAPTELRLKAIAQLARGGGRSRDGGKIVGFSPVEDQPQRHDAGDDGAACIPAQRNARHGGGRF